MERVESMARMRLVAMAAVAWVASGLVAPAAGADALARGDAAWARRGEGLVQGRPPLAPIAEAIEAYESALAGDPSRLEARWKLLRALHFAGFFAEDEAARARLRFDRAREVADAGVALLAATFGRAPHELPSAELRDRVGTAASARDVARFYFWAALDWGAWAKAHGLLAAVREGVANRVRDYALVTVALEPELEAGGANRLLAHLHAALPQVPLLSGWVDRSQAIPQAERALALAASDPGNRLLLALTLLDLGVGRREEALSILAEIAALEPRSESVVEDLAMRRAAVARLAQEHGATEAGG